MANTEQFKRGKRVKKLTVIYHELPLVEATSTPESSRPFAQYCQRGKILIRIISIIVAGGIEMACGKVRITFNQIQCYICIL